MGYAATAFKQISHDSRKTCCTIRYPHTERTQIDLEF